MEFSPCTNRDYLPCNNHRRTTTQHRFAIDPKQPACFDFSNSLAGENFDMATLRLLDETPEKPMHDFGAKPWAQISRLAAGCCVAVALVGCASAPAPAPSPKVPEAAPAVVSMDEWMARARTAASEGQREKARAAYRAAAQNYPTEKLPWLKLAEDYFQTQDYGNAVLAAQEALQRDREDSVAHSILAVSGLRLTAGSLVALRQDGSYPVGSRDEAITVARALRDTLGATSLLTQAPQNNVAVRTRKPSAQARTNTAQRPVPAAAGSAIVPTAATPAPAARGSAQGGSPFDKLK
jgi:tetratricopeptide (TPR) repeat protein